MSRLERGLTESETATLRRRLGAKIVECDGHELWAGAKSAYGHGKVAMRGNIRIAHRWRWILERGSIPDGLLVLHKCGRPDCVKLDHLYLGTQSDNMKDAVQAGTHFSLYRGTAKCKQGHEFTPENTRLYIGDGYTKRQCRTCAKGWAAAYRERQKS